MRKAILKKFIQLLFLALALNTFIFYVDVYKRQGGNGYAFRWRRLRRRRWKPWKRKRQPPRPVTERWKYG